MATFIVSDKYPGFDVTADTAQFDNPTTFTNTLTVEGDFTFGDAATDNLIVNGDLRINDDRFLHFGTNEDVSIEYDENDTNFLKIIGAKWQWGVDDLGIDVKMFGATTGRYWEWDESADQMNLFGTMVVGVNDVGHDVQFFGATSGAHLLWDESADDLKLVGAAGLTVAGTSALTITTVSSTLAVTGAQTNTVGIQSAAVARTSTSDGLTTGLIADGTTYVTVTSSSADNIITLPTPTPGNVVWLAVVSNGYELRSDTPASVAINGGSASNAESAVGANVLVRCVCTSATTWICNTFSSIGTEAALEAAAA